MSKSMMKWTLGLLAVGCMLVMAGPADAEEDDGLLLRAMTFNVLHGNASALAVGVLENHKPDVVGLQEALRSQIDGILNALPEYGEVVSGSSAGANGEYVPILYRTERFRVEESATFWFSLTPDVPGSVHPDNYWARRCTWAKLVDKESERAFFVYNLHLGGGAIEHNVQLLAQRVHDRDPQHPVVVLGDFNAEEDSNAIRYMKGEIPLGDGANPVPLVDTFRVVHPDAEDVGTTHDGAGNSDGRKIDYVFVLPGTEVIDAHILKDNLNGVYPSDHYPVDAQFRLYAPVPPIPGDANDDGIVNDEDASILAANWEMTRMTWGDGDFNDDQIVNDADASILAANWQSAGEEGAPVPEPVMLVLLAGGLMTLLLWRRK